MKTRVLSGCLAAALTLSCLALVACAQKPEPAPVPVVPALPGCREDDDTRIGVDLAGTNGTRVQGVICYKGATEDGLAR